MQRLLLISFILILFASGNALSGNSTDALLDLSYEQTKAGKLDDALSTLQQAVSEDPSSSLAHTRLGGIRVLRQEHSEGIKNFQQAIMLDQKNASAFVGIAVAYLHTSRYSLARAALNEAGKIDPSKKPEIDQVLAWIEQRTNGAPVSAH
ncbi:MAG: tetratricopeptide repeat protein [Pseudomonadota bacterium]